MVKNNNDKWGALSMSERASFINKIIKEHNISDLKTIKSVYNEYSSGGDTNEPPADITPAIIYADYPREAEVWEQADASNADIVQRLKQGASRATIPDWEDPRKVATHKMMSAGNYAVGNVQNINGQLFDFTDPKHKFEDSDRAAIDNAIKRGDYIEFETPGDARYFAEHYKKHYKDFADGGRILDGDEEEQTLSNTNVELPGVVVTPNGNYLKYTSNNENVSFEDYKDNRVQQDRITAVNNILNLQSPLVPEVPSLAARALMKLGFSENFATKCLGHSKHPHTCIYTTTGMYPKGSQVSGNITFKENPAKYGFTEAKNIQKGDMLQLLNGKGDPYHSVIVTGFAENGNPLLTYSNGGIDVDENNNGILEDSERHMRYNRDNLYLDENGFSVDNEDQYNIFRYVGNQEQLNNYKKEYEDLYKALGGPLYNKHNPIESFSGSSKIPVVRKSLTRR